MPSSVTSAMNATCLLDLLANTVHTKLNTTLAFNPTWFWSTREEKMFNKVCCWEQTTSFCYITLSIIKNTFKSWCFFSIPGSFDPCKKMFSCVSCGKQYKHRESLSRHIHQECGKLPKHSCLFCPYRTKHKHSLQTHVALKHSLTFNVIWCEFLLKWLKFCICCFFLLPTVFWTITEFDIS